MLECLICRYNNQSDALFCEHCGTGLVKNCPGCMVKNYVKARYCRHCGFLFTSIQHDPAPYPISKILDQHPVNVTCRRQLTILFCDLAGYSKLAEKLEPEDLLQLMHQYQTVAGNVVNHFQGYVAQYLGDGILVYFGYPEAHNNDAVLAIKAALQILRSIHQNNCQLKRDYGVCLELRIGIHTGQVVIGDLGIRGNSIKLALGHAANIASRLQNLAGAGQVLISGNTFLHCKEYYDCQPLGRKQLKNISQKMEVFAVLQNQAPSYPDQDKHPAGQSNRS